jgi:hypothetical protein
MARKSKMIDTDREVAAEKYWDKQTKLASKVDQATIDLEGRIVLAITKAQKAGLNRKQVMQVLESVTMNVVACPGETQRALKRVFVFAAEGSYLPTENPLGL